MTRNLKAIGLTIFVLGAFAALSASAASAAELKFHSESAETTLTGTSEGNQVLKLTSSGPELTCTHAEVTPTVIGTTPTTVTVPVNYTTPTCSGPLGSEVHVAFNGCGFEVMTTGTTVGTGNISCPTETGSITVTPTAFGSSLCTIHIKKQTPTTNTVDIHNKGAGTSREITINSTVSGIHEVVTGGGGACGSEGTHTDGSYTGSFTITGDNTVGGAMVGIWAE